MKTFLYIVGALQMIGGVMFAVEAASAIHQILAAAAFGLGSVCLGLAAIVARLERLAPAPEKPAPVKSGIDLTGTKGDGWKQA